MGGYRLGLLIKAGPVVLLLTVTAYVITIYSEKKIDKFQVESPSVPCPLKKIALADHDLPITALASFPRSGNTWIRHFLQQLSGIGAGSVYCSPIARWHGFPLECKRKRVIVVKTHSPHSHIKYKYDKAVVIVRNPLLSIVSYFHLVVMKDPFGYASSERLQNGFDSFARKQIIRWESFYKTWIHDFREPMHLVIYEHLKQHVLEDFKEISYFLNINYTDRDMFCAMENRHGSFLRNKSNISIHSLYSRQLESLFANATNRVFHLIQKKFKKYRYFSFQSLAEIDNL